jgi:hypothetical protein
VNFLPEKDVHPRKPPPFPRRLLKNGFRNVPAATWRPRKRQEFDFFNGRSGTRSQAAIALFERRIATEPVANATAD